MGVLLGVVLGAGLLLVWLAVSDLRPQSRSARDHRPKFASTADVHVSVPSLTPRRGRPSVVRSPDRPRGGGALKGRRGFLVGSLVVVAVVVAGIQA